MRDGKGQVEEECFISVTPEEVERADELERRLEDWQRKYDEQQPEPDWERIFDYEEDEA